jgi:branched-subunit amino acid transport protein AzlD
MIKFFIILVFVIIIISLGRALYYLIKNKKSSQKTVKYLTYRIAISFSLFILLSIAFMTGFIQPSGIGMQMLLQKQAQSNKTKMIY